MNKRLQQTLARRLVNPLPLDEAKEVWRQVRLDNGLSATTPNLLSKPSANTKLNKGGQYGLNLLPHRLGGVGNVCAWSTPGCREACINISGRGNMPHVQDGRKVRTILLIEHSEAFAALLMDEWMRLPKKAAIRLNVFSDIPWHIVWPELIASRKDIACYGYSKMPPEEWGDLPSNYHLTYSASERTSDRDIIELVNGQINVAVPFRMRRKDQMIKSWNGLTVIDGDKDDARYKDPVGVVVGLRAKGKAFMSESNPFVRSIEE